MDTRFSDILQFIQQSRKYALKAVNVELINLYWNVGAYIRQKLAGAEWGVKAVRELAAVIQQNHPELKGFDRTGLYRMVQFYETYYQNPIVAPVVRQIQVSDNENDKIVAPLVRQFEFEDIRKTVLVQISWTNHLIIFSRCKTEEEREFYVRMCINEKYSKRELDRQIFASLFERTMLTNTQFPVNAQALQTELINAFKDSYVFEFLNLPEPHNETDLKKGLIRQMKKFVLELGKDFLFVGEEYKVQVGNSDFYMDLLFYHRALQCLVAFELKADKFRPEHLGQLNFYLEALDRDVKKENEKPSIGILLCKDKENQVVEYALSRSLSPTMVSEYKTKLPDKKFLERKLHEIFIHSETETD